MPPGVDGAFLYEAESFSRTELMSIIVPIYDAREKVFKVSDYTTTLPRWHGEISDHAAVMVIFTASWYQLRQEKRPANDRDLVFDTALSLNVKAVIYIADSAHEYSNTDLPEEPLWGVNPVELVESTPVVIEDGGDEDL